MKMKPRLIALLMPAIAAASGAATLDRDAAYALLNARSGANRATFEVYRDADSGFNHGSPSGAFGATNKVHLDAACLDDTASASGCSSDHNRLDRLRGTVLRITFDSLGASESAGIGFEEPEQWSVRRDGKGYDLTGATSLAFDVRTPTPGGIDVQFGAGGELAGFVHVAPGSSFTAMTVPLPFLTPAALRDLHVLFAVATNGSHAPNGGTILIDNVRFVPTPQARHTAIGFPMASESFGIVPATSALPGRVPIPIDQATRNASTIYDSALTLMALLDRGTAEDLANATVIADAFHHALHHDNHGRPLVNTLALPATKTYATIRNGYKAGDLPLLNDEATGAKADDASLAGFSAGSDVCGASSFCVILDGATGGNVAFAILALVAAHQTLGNNDYRTDAELLGTWIVNELTDRSKTSGYGGYFVGYADREDPRRLVEAKSTADNAAIFAALSRLAATQKSPRLGFGGIRWSSEAIAAGDFVMRLFDEKTGRFFAGTVPAGTAPSFGVTPAAAAGGKEAVNTFDVGEANTLSVLALAPSGAYRSRIDWHRPMQHLLGTTLTLTANGTAFTGFGFGNDVADGPAGISWELTAQAAAAMRLVNCFYSAPLQNEISLFRTQLALAQSSAPFGDGKGVVGSTLQSGELVPAAEQCLSTPARCLPQRVGLAATAWSLFAERERNPLSASGTSWFCLAPRRRAGP